MRLRDHDIHVIVSLLCDSERAELGLDEEAAACSRHNMEFISLPVPDLGVPIDTGEFIEAVHRLTTLIRGGTRVAVHCRQSVGRSGLLAASVAVACEMPLQEALETISKARGRPSQRLGRKKTGCNGWKGGCRVPLVNNTLRDFAGRLFFRSGQTLFSVGR